jgi:phenylacetate-CoA ligase
VFADKKVDISKITTLAHLKDMPFTTKNDLRLSYPDGMVAVPRSKVVRIARLNPGTTGKSRLFFIR